MKILSAVFTSILIYSVATASSVELFPLFSSDAVLQRDKECPVWGIADSNAVVNVVLKSDDGFVTNIVTSTDTKGKWMVRFPARAAGGTYEISALSGDASTTSTNIVFGDVWICSGQSNMEMSYVWGLENGREDVETNAYKNIRLLNVPNRVTFSPVAGFDAKWHECNLETAKEFSACGYFFGVSLYNGLNKEVPIGLIDVTWSGTIIETWISYEKLSEIDDEFKKNISERLADIDEWNNGGAELFDEEMTKWSDSLNIIGSTNNSKSYEPDCNDSAWKEVSLPLQMELHISNSFDGIVWYRGRVTLTDEQAAATNAFISLGPIDDCDVTYINGVKVGEMTTWNQPREYKIPLGTLKSGDNVIAVRAFDYGGGGGFLGSPAQMYIDLDGTKLSLAKKWKYVESTLTSTNKKPKDFRNQVPNTFAACYNGMMHQLFPAAIRGAIWYQGCSNVGRYEQYYKLFKAMLEDWRSNFSGGDFPVYMVQLAAFMQTHEQPIESCWPAMRWTQTRLGEEMKNCGTAVAIDIGNHNDIHPKDKKTVGERLARLALSRTYFKEITDASPIPVAASIRDPSAEVVIVRFKNSRGLKSSDGEELKGFQLSNGKGFKKVSASVIDEGISLSVPEEMRNTTSLTVRYAWDDYPDCNLVNDEGLPCGPFEIEAKANAVLENNAVRMVFDMSTCRIISFSEVNGENVLWTDPLASIRRTRSGHWLNWGGEKTWLWPMTAWRSKTGKIWPPRREMEMVEEYEMEEYNEWRDEASHSFSLKTPVIPGFGVRILKSAEIKAGDDNCVTVVAELEPKSADVSPWSVVQVPIGDGTFFVRTASADCLRIDDSHLFSTGKFIGDGVVKFSRNGTYDEKAGFIADVLAVRRGSSLFALVCRDATLTTKSGETVQVFSSKDSDIASEMYFELEYTSPISVSASPLTVEWMLFPLSEKAGDTEIAEIIGKI